MGDVFNIFCTFALKTKCFTCAFKMLNGCFTLSNCGNEFLYITYIQ